MAQKFTPSLENCLTGALTVTIIQLVLPFNWLKLLFSYYSTLRPDASGFMLFYSVC